MTQCVGANTILSLANHTSAPRLLAFHHGSAVDLKSTGTEAPQAIQSTHLHVPSRTGRPALGPRPCCKPVRLGNFILLAMSYGLRDFLKVTLTVFMLQVMRCPGSRWALQHFHDLHLLLF